MLLTIGWTCHSWHLPLYNMFMHKLTIIMPKISELYFMKFMG